MVVKGGSGQAEEGGGVEDGIAGEVGVRGANVMLGYFNRPEATAAVFRNGWLRTGDLASRMNGYFTYHDRLKDMIKSGGENGYSAAGEQGLHRHPPVAEARVSGLAVARWGAG